MVKKSVGHGGRETGMRPSFGDWTVAVINDEQELLLQSLTVHDATKAAVTEELLLTLKRVGNSTKTYTFKSRLKPAHSISRKVSRKRQEGRALAASLQGKARTTEVKASLAAADKMMSYSPEHVTDVYGFRYVTLYQSDIPIIVAELLRSLEEFNDRLRKDEEPVRPIEFVVYTNRPLTDPLSIASQTLNLVKQTSFAKLIHDGNIRPPESRKSAYSSVHFVFARSFFADAKRSDEVIATMEIQIRDIFEEGWGEVQHHLLYSNKDNDGDELEAAPVQREHWELHLNALKTFVDGCGQHASIIKRNLEELRAAATPTALTQSVSELDEDREQVQLALRRRNSTREVLDAVTVGYGLLLSDNASHEAEARIANLEAATDAFTRAIDSLDGASLDQPTALPGGRSVGYHLKMELASARTRAAAAAAERAQSGDLGEERCSDLNALVTSCRAEAKTIYEEILKSAPADPVSAMRLGKLLSADPVSPDSLDAAVDRFDQAIASLDADESTGPEHWMAISLRIDRGLALWKKSKLAEVPEERARLLAETVAATLEGYHAWRSQSNALHEANKITGHKAGSNAIYFIAERAELGHAVTPEEESTLRQLIAYIEGIKIDQYSDYYKTVDNLMHGYLALGERTHAQTLALENFSTLRRDAEVLAARPLDGHEIADYLQASPLACFNAAKRVLSGL